MRLFHFSEDPEIRVFRPHVPEHRPEVNPLVWAIDEWHAPMYYVPRQCPRACFWPGPQTIDEDRERWFGPTPRRMVIAIESRWLDRLRSTVLYRYDLPPDTFTRGDEIAGHWVSREPVEPTGVERIDDLLAALVASDVELRIMPTLGELWHAVIRTTLCYSGTRLRNAVGYEPPADH
jgi:hypothetical protein